MEALVRDFLVRAKNSDPIDSRSFPTSPEIVSYLAGVLQETPEEDLADLDVGELVAGFFPELQVAEPLVAALLADADALARSQRQEQRAAEAARALQEASARLNAASLEDVPARTSSGASSSSRGSGGGGGSPRPSADEAAHVATLAALLPDAGALPDGFLLHALRRRCGGSVEAAAAWALGAGPDGVAAEGAAWAAAAARRAAAAAADAAAAAATKAAVVERFDLRPEGGGGAAALGAGRRGVHAWGGGKAAAAPAAGVRYHEGQPIRTKQKYVVEKVGEEWDGGSRGRVKLKGKRGPGWAG